MAKVKTLDLTPEQARERAAQAEADLETLKDRVRRGEAVKQQEWTEAREAVEFAAMQIEGAERLARIAQEEEWQGQLAELREQARETLAPLAAKVAAKFAAARDALLEMAEAHDAYEAELRRIRFRGQGLRKGLNLGPNDREPLYADQTAVVFDGKVATTIDLGNFVQALVYYVAEGREKAPVERRNWYPADLKYGWAQSIVFQRQAAALNGEEEAA